MNKKHWITVTPGKNITKELFRELVVESYLLVVSKLPRGSRPYGWELFDPQADVDKAASALVAQTNGDSIRQTTQDERKTGD